jgi:cobalt-zinc-cadmium efflux system membrane fusion protein
MMTSRICCSILRCAAIVAGAALTLVGCRRSAPLEPTQQPTANLKVEAVYTQPVDSALRIPGRVEADPLRLVHVYAPLSGRLLDLKISPGQEVHKGQTIAMLQSGDVAQSRSDFEKARIEAERADRALTRGRLLAAHEVMSQAELQELQATDAADHAEEERARQRIHELGFSENGTTDVAPIISPINGTVLEVGTASGEMQRSLETTNGIATVANLDEVWVTGDLFEQDLGAVHLHDPVSITFSAYPRETFRGNVANIGESLDPSTHAVKIRVVLANPSHRLKPDMFATLSLSRPTVLRIIVPQTAVLHDGNVTEVYVPTADGKYVVRQVTTGASSDGRVEIISGLQNGEKVVTEGAAFLREPAGD